MASEGPAARRWRTARTRRLTSAALAAAAVAVLSACAPPPPADAPTAPAEPAPAPPSPRAEAPILRGADGPLPVRFNIAPLLEALLRDPTASPPGANDPTCRPSDAHPRPVVLVSGLTQTRTFWQTLSPLLANNGFCVFALTYGSPPGVPWLGGIRPIAESSADLASFVEEVLELTGAEEVDLVGHSEGTVMPQHYLKRRGGADRVHAYVAIAPLYGGTTAFGTDAILGQLLELPFGLGEAIASAFDSICGACRDVITGSQFLTDLYGDGVVAVPGVEYTTVVSRHDELIHPWTSGLLDAPNATNFVVQDGCEQDHSEHLSIAVTPRALGAVLNALDPQNAVEPPCVPTWYAFGVGDEPQEP